MIRSYDIQKQGKCEEMMAYTIQSTTGKYAKNRREHILPGGS